MKVLSEVNIFERLIDFGRNKVATDVDDYAIERLLQSTAQIAETRQQDLVKACWTICTISKILNLP